MQKDPKTPMSKWITSVRDVARQIKDLKGDVPDEEVIVVLPDELPPGVLRAVGCPLGAMVETDRTISHVITRLIGEERRQAGRDQGNDLEEVSLGLLAAKRKRRDRSDITCGHFRSNCPEEQEQEVYRKPPAHSIERYDGLHRPPSVCRTRMAMLRPR